MRYDRVAGDSTLSLQDRLPRQSRKMTVRERMLKGKMCRSKS